MAESKTPTAPLYTVKHVDGVMHLSLNPDADPKAAAKQLRVLPPVVESELN